MPGIRARNAAAEENVRVQGCGESPRTGLIPQKRPNLAGARILKNGHGLVGVAIQGGRAAGTGERDARESIGPPGVYGEGERERGSSFGVGDLRHVESNGKQFLADRVEAAQPVVSTTGRERRRRVDGSARVTVRRSKTDPEGEGAVQYVGKAAAEALREIRPGDPDPGARVFGLKSGRAVSNRIQAAAKAARLDGAFSGRSPRIGMAADLVRAGFPTAAVQNAGRGASDRMAAYYTRSETAAWGAVAEMPRTTPAAKHVPRGNNHLDRPR